MGRIAVTTSLLNHLPIPTSRPTRTPLGGAASRCSSLPPPWIRGPRLATLGGTTGFGAFSTESNPTPVTPVAFVLPINPVIVPPFVLIVVSALTPSFVPTHWLS